MCGGSVLRFTLNFVFIVVCIYKTLTGLQLMFQFEFMTVVKISFLFSATETIGVKYYLQGNPLIFVNQRNSQRRYNPTKNYR